MEAKFDRQWHMVGFARYIGIDYSGEGTPRTSLPGLRVCMAEGDGLLMEDLPAVAAKVLDPAWCRGMAGRELR
jgi:hypothetical protein